MDEKKRIALWEEYARTKSSKIREKLILEYAGLAGDCCRKTGNVFALYRRV